MKYKVAIKRPGQPLEITEIEGEYRTDVAPLIESTDYHPQFVQIKASGSRILALACDEDGLLKNLPLNFQLLLKNGPVSRLDDIVGTVVFCVYIWEDAWDHEIYDYKLADLNEEDIQLIEHIISEKMQKTGRALAKASPYIRTDKEILFQQIHNVEDYLKAEKTDLLQVEAHLIPLCLFFRRPTPTSIEFFADPAGVHKYTTGLQPCSAVERRAQIFCKNEKEAKDFTMYLEYTETGCSMEELFEKVYQYLSVLKKWGLPAFLYVSKETYQKHLT